MYNRNSADLIQENYLRIYFNLYVVMEILLVPLYPFFHLTSSGSHSVNIKISMNSFQSVYSVLK